jgi:alpha-galactosidase
MRKRKLVLIGAGSAVFTRGLVADLILDSSPWELCLVDISPENLAVAHGLARRMIDLKKADITLSHTLDRREALPGADVVVTTIAVGGRRAWEADVFIPRKYGIFQPVGDTIMPGGISRALRMIPALVDIARDVKALAPNAHFFNYSNPMSANCRAIRKAAGASVVGLCHGVPHVEAELAAMAGAPLKKCKFTSVGINHLTWITKWDVAGKNGFDMLRSRLAELDAKGQPRGDRAEHFFSFEALDIFGAFPAVFDRHVTEFFPQLFRDGSHYGGKLGVDRFAFEPVIESGDKGFAAMKAQAEGREPLDEAVFNRTSGEHEKLIEILDSLESPRSKVFSVNLPNTGQVANISRDFVIECPARISSKGVKAVKVGAIPTGCAATVEKALLTVELTVEAALERDHNKLVQALIFDGSVKSVADANALADELIAVHKEYLPGW